MTIRELETRNREAGFYFFSRGALEFFSSRIHPAVYEGPGGVFFVTSERCRPFHRHSRAYTVREFHTGGDVRTHGEFQEYSYRQAAHSAAEKAAKGTDNG